MNIDLLGLFKKSNSNDEIYSVCKHILSKTNIMFTQTKVKKLLNDDPNFPSLLSIQETLMFYGIESAAVKRGSHSYDEFDTPFVCSVQRADWPSPNFTVVESIKDSRIEYLDPITAKIEKMDLLDFERIDKDIVLLLDLDSAHDEEKFKGNLKIERLNRNKRAIPYFLMIGLIIFMLINIWINNIGDVKSSVFSNLILITGAIGSLISALLIWNEIDTNNPFLKEVCGEGSRQMSCNVVLGSKGASFLSIKWSEIGMSYFLTQLLSTFFFLDDRLNYSFFWTFSSLLASPYIIYSIYYQAKIIKQWCPLCLFIQGLLILNLLSAIYYLSFGAQFTDIATLAIVKMLLLGLTVLCIVHLIIPIFKMAFQSTEYKKGLQKLRYNNKVFDALLKNQSMITRATDNLGILIGNPNAPIEITKVCNPLCGPCSRAHPILEDIIDTNPSIKMRIIFVGNGDDFSLITAPVSHLLAIQEQCGSERVREALDDWYKAKDKDYNRFALKFPIEGHVKDQKDKMIAMNDWCNEMKVRATPTIYINGYELPEVYKVADLKYFLTD